MFNLQVKVNDDKYNIAIGKVKFLYGSNYKKKLKLFSAIKMYFSNIENSEYAIEQNKQSYLRINEKEIPLRKWKLFTISDKLELQNDFKLSSKALITKYFETILRDIEYEELVTTLNALLKDLEKVIEDKMEHLKLDFRLNPELLEINTRQIIKMITIDLYKDECRANVFDLDYEKLLLMEMRMIKEICRENQLKNYLVLVDIRKITEELYKEMRDEKINNLHFIVSLEHAMGVNISDVVDFGRNVVDFSNEVDIYNEVMMESQSAYTLEEVKGVIKDYVLGVNSDKVIELKKILN